MKVLVVEDDDNLRSGLQDLLELEAFEVITAATASKGLKVFFEQAPDFCIFDVMLPDFDGFTLCKKIRENNTQTPVLMLSARGEEIDRVLGFESGADDYVTKPFGPRELVARIHAILRRTKHPQLTDTQSRFNMQDLEIDPLTQRAYRSDFYIDLTEREVRILQLFYLRSGQVISRDDIYNSAWGRDFQPNSRALDQTISTLRHKVEADPNLPCIIQTVRGVGYRFDADL